MPFFFSTSGSKVTLCKGSYKYLIANVVHSAFIVSKIYVRRQYSAGKINCAFICCMFLINCFEGKLDEILPLDHQWCSIDMQMILEISMHRYLKIKSCIFTAIYTQLTHRLRSSSFAVICAERSEAKWCSGASKLSKNKCSLSASSVAGGGKRSFPIAMVHSWRPCWIDFASKIYFISWTSNANMKRSNKMLILAAHYR